MKRLFTTALLSLTLVSTATRAAAPVADEAVFVEGARYNAVLSRGANAWRLLPLQGDDRKLSVAEHCRAGLEPPRGLWLLTRNAEGLPQLVAPSATPLPAGHPGHIRLVECGQPIAADEAVLALPVGLIAWLQQNSGTIYVTD
ncbi:hypothetical protein [Arenimonas daejeonensis]|uniref:hypothetical protein n=1 Tax=Arenimonas daejeonensis TaxID=370777 RepID=UPI0011BD4A98|nr:hypothetical protein [Arenimonas daejeonensis]